MDKLQLDLVLSIAGVKRLRAEAGLLLVLREAVSGDIRSGEWTKTQAG